MRFPATKQRETGTNFNLHGIFENLEVRSGDVSDLVAVVDVLRRSWEDGL